MVEFTSSPKKPRNPLPVTITVVVLILVLGSVYFTIQRQRTRPQQSGAAAVAVAGMLRPGNTDFEYYKTRIRIENVKAVLGISFNQTRTAMISGTILNDGDRKLDALELRIVLYDVWGKVSKERTVFALRPKAGYGGKAMQPLERRTFAVGIESVEYYWDPKQITYEITGLRYE